MGWRLWAGTLPSRKPTYLGPCASAAPRPGGSQAQALWVALILGGAFHSTRAVWGRDPVLWCSSDLTPCWRTGLLPLCTNGWKDAPPALTEISLASGMEESPWCLSQIHPRLGWNFQGLGKPCCLLDYGVFLVAQMVKSLPATQETWVQFLGLGDSLEKGMATPLQYSCLENSHEQRSLVGYSSWDCKESDTTEQLTLFTS